MMVYIGNTGHIKKRKIKISFWSRESKSNDVFDIPDFFYEQKSGNPKIIAGNSLRSPKIDN